MSRSCAGTCRPASSSRILDVGCGAGLFFDRLSEFGGVQGVEADSTMKTGRPEIDNRIHWGTLESFGTDPQHSMSC